MSETPKEYKNNLTQRIITEEMLGDCLYSVNKRAKNCRDKANDYRHYDIYGNQERYTEQKEKYYRMKDILLSITRPVCIHREYIGNEVKRFYEGQDSGYDEFVNSEKVVKEGGYFDKDEKEYVNFIDVRTGKINYNYYYFYQIGNYSFHHPIEFCDEPPTNIELPIIDIDTLVTHGEKQIDLMSTQFCKKLVELIKSKDYLFIPSVKLCGVA